MMKLQIEKNIIQTSVIFILLITSVIVNVFLYFNNKKLQETYKSEVQTLQEEVQKLEKNQREPMGSILQPMYKEEEEAEIKSQYLDCLSDMIKDNPTADAEMIGMYRTLCSDITGFKN